MKMSVGLVCALLLSSSVMAANPPTTSGMPLEQRISLLERKIKALSQLSFRLEALQREVRELRGDVEVQTHNIEGMKQRQRALYLDIDQRLSQLGKGPDTTATTPGQASSSDTISTGSGGTVMLGSPATSSNPTGTDASTPTLPSGDPAKEEQTYQQAFEILKQRRYDEARVALQDFLNRYPSGDYADNAQYWLAEASYVTRDFDTALAEFGKVLTEHPSSLKVPDALLKRAFIQYEQKRWDEARASLQKVVNEYPESTAARLAQQRLERMRSERR